MNIRKQPNCLVMYVSLLCIFNGILDQLSTLLKQNRLIHVKSGNFFFFRNHGKTGKSLSIDKKRTLKAISFSRAVIRSKYRRVLF